MKHPKGLYYLFFTEMWERFSFYGMKAILVLFLTSNVAGGFGWSSSKALTLLGIFTAGGYFLSIPGGWIADKKWGARKAVLYGGAILCLGHFMMLFRTEPTFFAALSLIALGTGLLKPNISSLVGALYSKDQANMQAGGFTIFYMGINLGSFLASILVALVANKYGWHWGFSLAGFGMLLGQIVFMLGRKHVTDTELRGKKQDREPLVPADYRNIKVIALVMIVVCLFWIAYEQTSGMITLYAESNMNRYIGSWQIPTAMFQAVNAGLILILSAPIARFWIKREKNKRRASALFKMGVGLVILGLGFSWMYGALAQQEIAMDHKSTFLWLLPLYFFHTVGELCLSPVALSFVTSHAPKGMISTLMGIFFAVTGSANYLAAFVGKLALKWGMEYTFTILLFSCVLIGLSLVWAVPLLLRYMKGDSTSSLQMEHAENN